MAGPRIASGLRIDLLSFELREPRKRPGARAIETEPVFGECGEARIEMDHPCARAEAGAAIRAVSRPHAACRRKARRGPRAAVPGWLFVEVMRKLLSFLGRGDREARRARRSPGADGGPRVASPG